MENKESFDNVLINHEDLFLKIKRINIKVREGVFSPNPSITNSTLLLLNHIKGIKNKYILDVGCGSGIVSIYCAMNGAKKVVASDVDIKAIENTKENLNLLGINDKVEVIKSSLFENIHGKYDIICANLPINEDLWDIKPKELVRRFIWQAKNYLKENGKIYLVWFSISDVNPIRKYCREKNYKIKEISEEKYGFKWYLFELTI